ncbi:hypothetical protein ACETU7_14780 [Rhodococcus sp. 3Y1]
MSKEASDTSVRAAAQRAGIALIAVHPDARWDRLFTTIRGVLDHSVSRQDSDDIVFGSDTDLFELAQNVAAITRGWSASRTSIPTSWPIRHREMLRTSYVGNQSSAAKDLANTSESYRSGASSKACGEATT